MILMAIDTKCNTDITFTGLISICRNIFFPISDITSSHSSNDFLYAYKISLLNMEY